MLACLQRLNGAIEKNHGATTSGDRSAVVFGFGFGILLGGRAISEFAKVDRLLSELDALAIAAVCGGIGFVAESAGKARLNAD